MPNLSSIRLYICTAIMSIQKKRDAGIIDKPDWLFDICFHY